MTKKVDVQVEKAVELDSQHITVTPYGLEFQGKPSTEEWYLAFQKVSQLHGMAQFYLGDLAVEAQYEWGDKYTDLVKLTGYDEGTLANYASVARRFTSAFRENLHAGVNNLPPFSAFSDVTSLDDDRAMYYLGLYSEAKWTREKLREEVKRYKNGGSLPEPREAPVGEQTFKEYMKNFFKGYVPNLSNEEYDETSWLLEIRDVIEERLGELGVVLE
jgi:hypothetical protein